MSHFNPALSFRTRGVPGGLPFAGAGLPSDEPHAFNGHPNDPDFVALQACLRATGGLARGDDLALCLGQGQPGGHARLARLMVCGQVFSFAWLDTYWVPMFQFDPVDLRLRTASGAVLRELVEVLDGWSLALWFVQPCRCLAGRSPLSLLGSDLPAVLQAARLKRYVVEG